MTVLTLPQMVAMVDLWRRAWSKEANTTDPMAPFGIVTLASGGSEGNFQTHLCIPTPERDLCIRRNKCDFTAGGSDIGGMRWSQTGNFGTLPSPEMPNTFLARKETIEFSADFTCCLASAARLT